MEYERADRSVEPKKIQCGQFRSTQHAERLKAVRKSDESAECMSETNQLTVEKVNEKTLVARFDRSTGVSLPGEEGHRAVRRQRPR